MKKYPDIRPRPRPRPRKQREGQAVRDRYADVKLSVDQLIVPVFVRDGKGIAQPVSSMPGVEQWSVDVALERLRGWRDIGLRRVLPFGVIDPRKKDATGSAAFDPRNPVNMLIRAVREAKLDVEILADLCFCEYTDHGHCGVPHSDPNTTVDNDATLPLLGRQAVVLADSGVDWVAPSGMMDGMVGAIREALDAAGHKHVKILSYAIKYASALYGPFREAGEGSPKFGDRRGYQMDYRRSDEWKVELELDLAEGADAVMVKPAMAYLDIVRGVRDAAPGSIPVAAYHVSGEYSMIHAAAERGWVDLKAVALEHTTAIRRAGADWVVTYFAPKLAEWICGQ
ncbi:MAG: porphobilinogen synthase [Phycisphaeraceae bacterium]